MLTGMGKAVGRSVPHSVGNTVVGWLSDAGHARMKALPVFNATRTQPAFATNAGLRICLTHAKWRHIGHV